MGTLKCWRTGANSLWRWAVWAGGVWLAACGMGSADGVGDNWTKLIAYGFRDGKIWWFYPTNGVTEYRVEGTAGLQSGAWHPVIVGISPSGDYVSVTVPMAEACRFYRTKALLIAPPGWR